MGFPLAASPPFGGMAAAALGAAVAGLAPLPLTTLADVFTDNSVVGEFSNPDSALGAVSNALGHPATLT